MQRDEELLRLLGLACEHLDMQTAFVSELTDTHQLYRAVAGDAASFGLTVGQGPQRQDTFCDRMVAGQLPHVIADAGADARVRDLAVTRQARIGAYVGVPLTLPDGRLYGTLCCLSHRPDPRLDERDGKFLELIAGMIVGRVDTMETVRVEHAEVRRVIETEEVDVALQPILCLATGKYRGAEALARFPSSSRRVDEMFALAAATGLGPELELLALRRALAHLPEVPGEAYLSVNMSPEGIADPRFVPLVRRCAQLHRVVLEVTEHAPVEQYAALHEVLGPLRAAGLRLAVDDVGSGYASFRHVLQLRPDIIKIDRSLVDGIAADPALRTIAGNIVLLGLDLRAEVVAEGVETLEDLEVLETLGADMAQGYLFARPSTAPADWRSWAAVAPRATATAAAAVTGSPSPAARSRASASSSSRRPAGPEFSRCAAAKTFQQACDLVTDDLVSCGFARPSVYVLAGRILRCASARGYFQVVDGFEIGAGVIGRVAATGHPALIRDVSADPDFITADPGILSEAAVPVWVDGRIVAVVNVESSTVLPASTLTVLAAAATTLSTWTAAHGGAPTVEPQDEMVRACRDLAALRYAGPVRRRALAAAVELSGMSSAMIVEFGADDSCSVTAAAGPLADTVRGWSPSELRAMAAWVSRGTSSHVPGGDSTGPCHAFLEQAGIGALAVHPLTGDHVTCGLLIVLDQRRPSRAQPGQRALVEQLAASTAMALRAAKGEEPPRPVQEDVTLDRSALIEQWWRRLSEAQRDLARAARGGPLSPGLVQSLCDAGMPVVAYPPGVSGELAQCWMPPDVAQYIDSLGAAADPPVRAARAGKRRSRRDHSAT